MNVLPADPAERQALLEQYMTPLYAAEALVKIAGITDSDRVVEPSCGRGTFLQSIPASVKQVVGIEVDSSLADQAVINSGRPVITGDFRTVEIPFQPTLFIGNPPFSRRTVDEFLRRIHRELPWGGRAAFILPAYHFQWARPTMEWAEMFSIEQAMIPRELFPGLTKPLNWVVFTKERIRRMVGFLIYPETVDTKDVSPEAKLMLVHGKPRKGAWRSVVEAALEAAGGEAHVQDIYRFVAGRRPTDNPNWQQQIRKVLQEGEFTPRGDGVWSMAA